MRKNSSLLVIKKSEFHSEIYQYVKFHFIMFSFYFSKLFMFSIINYTFYI